MYPTLINAGVGVDVAVGVGVRVGVGVGVGVGVLVGVGVAFVAATTRIFGAPASTIIFVFFNKYFI